MELKVRKRDKKGWQEGGNTITGDTWPTVIPWMVQVPEEVTFDTFIVTECLPHACMLSVNFTHAR